MNMIIIFKSILNYKYISNHSSNMSSHLRQVISIIILCLKIVFQKKTSFFLIKNSHRFIYIRFVDIYVLDFKFILLNCFSF